MAYNNVWLKPEYLRFQLYLWKEGLDRNAPTEVFVIKTLIYGVRPSGNLMMAAFKLVSDYAVRNWPEHARGANALQKAYVDDLVHATRDKGSAKEDANSLLFVLSLAQLSIKGFTFSGQARPPKSPPTARRSACWAWCGSPPRTWSTSTRSRFSSARFAAASSQNW